MPPRQKPLGEYKRAVREMGRALGWSEADVRSVADAGCYLTWQITLGAGFINNGALLPMERASDSIRSWATAY